MEELAEPESRNEELVMRCRKNVRKLIVEYNAAADKTTTALYKFRQAIVALKSAPSQLAPPHTQANRYDDYVYVHQQSMAGHPPSDPGPHPGHRGPAAVDDVETRLRATAEAGPLSTPVQRRPKRPGVPGNLFLIEGFINPEEMDPAEHHGRGPEPGDQLGEH